MIAILMGVLPVFALIALGYFLKRSGFLPLELWGPIERLSIHVLYPGFLIPAIWKADMSGGSAGAAALAAVTAVIVIGVVTVALRPLMKIDGPAFTSVFQGAIRWNSFVFLPVIQAVFGQPGLALSAVIIGALIPVVNILCVLVMVRWGEGQGGTSPKAVARAMLQNPILVACLTGLALNLTGVPPIPGVFETLQLLGDAALPLGLIIAGAGLSFTYAARRPWTLGLTSAAKVLLMPPLMWGLCRLYGGDDLAQGVALLCGAAPGAAASYVLARQMGGDAPLMAGIVALTTVTSALTIPLFLTAFHFA
ncbi:AEC family transporter [Caulobacter sp. 17J80-11]|uniref:AEC family transporter n=1 Tax=Caulobacter sp. 17J80-11 TaxID=2763502 RepID=UPI00165370B0|nr:AEC family transporter [Caulobacter sp. 17J80-11]